MKRIGDLNLFLVLSLFFLPLLIHASPETFPTPPQQPATGPGGKDYRHAEVIKSVYGEGDRQYWIFEPAKPAPKSAPLIVFNHGWSAMNPKTYGAWIDHLVKRGNIVVYPRYQANLRTSTKKFTQNAIQAVKDAILQLQKGNHVKPQLDKFAIVGHSAGGQVTANMAALASSSGLPAPKAIMCVQPGKTWAKKEKAIIPLTDLSTIPGQVLMLTVVGDRDNIARDIDAKKIFYQTPQIPLSNKDFITLVSDEHGKPPLIANHFAPAAVDESYDSGEATESRKKSSPLRSIFRERLRERISKRRKADDSDFKEIKDTANSVNALDYYGLWKLFDALCDAAFYGKNRVYALGNTPAQRFMGKWSDGTPVKELIVTDNP